ncbi:MAG: energy-coupling factor transporter transmembrane protein EcfT [Treponema sp.]|nr:energy-coupling factor transporter transmembrane protein EcfT [Treponema sp.]
MLDARTKLFFSLLLTLLILFVDKLAAAVCLMISCIVIRLVSGVTGSVIGYIKNLTLLAAFIIAVQMLFAPGESYIIKPLFPYFIPVLGGIGSLKWEGLMLGVIIACRLAALMVFLPVFTGTTPLHGIASGLCSMGVNYRIAFIFTVAFNFVYLFKYEAVVIMNAQRLRGMRKTGLKAAAGILIPLILGAMRKARDSSVAMDSRAFGIYEKRTWIDKPEMRKIDYFFIAGSVVFFICIILINYNL